MNIKQYLVKKSLALADHNKYRTICKKCIQPDFGCYCSHVQIFNCHINFVILIHPIEVKRRIATGRMSHLCLQDSYLITGQDYTQDHMVNSLLQDPDYQSVILYPGSSSKNLSLLDDDEKINIFSQNKKLRIFVIDGTWATARKMIRQSENLKCLPRICFSPTTPSNFRVRKQPHPNCYSTIEAIHHTIELIGQSQGYDPKTREHDKLLKVFDYMVERQLGFIKESNLNLRKANYRSYGQKKISLS